MDTLKIIAPLCTATGSILLAVRVKIFLDSYRAWQKAADARLYLLTKAIADPASPIVCISGTETLVEKQTRYAPALLWGGFTLIVVGALISAYTQWLC